jgi:hypothetical protein
MAKIVKDKNEQELAILTMNTSMFCISHFVFTLVYLSFSGNVFNRPASPPPENADTVQFGKVSFSLPRLETHYLDINAYDFTYNCMEICHPCPICLNYAKGKFYLYLGVKFRLQL